MATFSSNNVELQYQDLGDGEPVVLIHGSIITDSFVPIAEDIAADHRFVAFRRRGYKGTPPHEGCTMSMAANDVLALMDHLDLECAHIVGHSYGGVTALQLVRDAPERVHTLSLFEPPLLFLPIAELFAPRVEEIVSLYHEGEERAALMAFLVEVGGPHVIQRVNQVLEPGWFEQALADFHTVVSADLPSTGDFEFSAQEAAGVTQPSLVLLGSESAPLFADGCGWLNEHLRGAEPLVVERTTHMLHQENPEPIARGLLQFLARHPMSGR